MFHVELLIWWTLLAIVVALLIGILRGARQQLAAVDLVYADLEGGPMAEIEQVSIEIGETRRVRVTGRLRRTGEARPIEGLAAEVASGTRYSVAVEGDVLVISSALLPGDLPEEVTDPETGEVTTKPGITDDDSSLIGALTVSADRQIGEGVRTLTETLALLGHLPEADDLVFEDITDSGEGAPVSRSSRRRMAVDPPLE